MVVETIRTKYAVVHIMDDYCRDKTQADIEEILRRISMLRPVASVVPQTKEKQ